MYQEINLTTTQPLIVLVVLTVLLVKTIRHKHYITIKLPEPSEQPDDRTALQARYGAYIQSQGKYYN